ncbi:restriction endonuclease [Massilia rubra]|uniref:Restriction endonuclease n=1 Tax=Massilia rubra TaxID=2607910 RepID=A0ABX0LN61_9BURK|nr:restriction endonuclease [Massilia rubra]NHZ32944.1 restriction endonuclease [Massilia rubra]
MEVLVLILAVVTFALWAMSVASRSAADELAAARLRALSMANVDAMNGIEFEHYAAALLANEGFTDVQVTRASGDNGVDIMATRGEKRYAIQAKRYKGTVSRRAVSDAVAGMLPYGCNACMVITSGHLSPKAMDFARAHQCEIVDRDVLADWVMRFRREEPLTQYGGSGQPTEPTYHPDTQARAGAVSVTGSIDVTAGRGAASATPVPAAVMTEIKQYARSQHPTDYSTAAYVVREAINDYRALRELAAPYMPHEVYQRVVANAAESHPADYSTQLYVVKDQLESYRALQQLEASPTPPAVVRQVTAEAEENHPDDFSTQIYVMNDQIRSYVELQQIGR